MLNLCVWAKSTPGQGSFYRSQHELIAVFRVGAENHQNNIKLGRFERNRSNVWTYPGINSFGGGRAKLLRMHPTVKPIALVVDAMRDCTTKGDVVLDSFVGSGTTILAAEKIGRLGYGLEFEPRYVDVGVQRWEAYSKSEAVLEGDGRTYAEIKAERLEKGTGAPSSANPDPAKEIGLPPNSDERGDGDWVSLCAIFAVTPTAGEK
jgi:DNA modification methylase